MARKTVDVKFVLDRVNHMLSMEAAHVLKPGMTAEQGFRVGVAHLLEAVLHETDNYAGYNLLGSEYLPADEQTADNVIRADADDTKRHYYASSALR